MAKRRPNRRNYSNQSDTKSNAPTSQTDEQDRVAPSSQNHTDLSYAINFTRSYLAQMTDPYLQNMILKDMNMNPRKIDRENLLKLIEDPKQNEQALREFSQYIENTVIQFKRTVKFFSSLLAFDNYIEPTNADADDMKTPAFLKSYKKAIGWLDKFSVKEQLPNIMKQILRQDAAFYYVRETKDRVFLQEMPINYCKIISKTDYGYQYAFDMSYFAQTGVDINNYDPIFKTYYDDYKNKITNNSVYRDWSPLDPIKAPCFKFDETVAGIVPPFMGLFPDAIDIGTFRELTKEKNELDVYKIILNQIPMHGGDGKTRKASDLALDAGTAGKFSRIMEEKSPNKKIKVMTTPFESEVHNLQRSENGNTEVDIGNKIFNNSTGVNHNILGGDGTQKTVIETSLKNAYTFVSHMYPVFERFINAYLKQVTGRYRWKIHLEGTEYDRQERTDRAFKAAGSGFPKSWVAVAMGKTPDELINMSNFENSLGLVDTVLKPFQSAHTMSNGEGGRPQSENLDDSGESTLDGDGNDR